MNGQEAIMAEPSGSSTRSEVTWQTIAWGVFAGGFLLGGVSLIGWALLQAATRAVSIP